MNTVQYSTATVSSTVQQEKPPPFGPAKSSAKNAVAALSCED